MRYRHDVSSEIINGIKTKVVAFSTALVLAMAGSSLLVTATALGAGSTTRYVGHGTVGTNKNCTSPGYTSVQAAVDAAAAGDKVYLCGAQFAEQVFIGKSITLTGDSTSGLTAVGTTFTTATTRYPTRFTTDGLFVPQALLIITGASTHTDVKGLTFSGPMPGNGGCAENEFGILALEGMVELNNDSVLNIADSNPSLYGCQFGVGIQIGRYYWPTANFSSTPVEKIAAHAEINHVTVTGYQKNGINIDGTGSRGNVTNNTVTGGGRGAPFGVIIAQNGIQVGRGAGGVVDENTVSNNSYTGSASNASSGGILLFGGCGDPLTTGVEISGNMLTNNDVGIYALNELNDCVTPPTTATNIKVKNNTISNDSVTNHSAFQDSHGTTYNGYQAGIDEQGNHDLLKNNKISGTGYAPQNSAPLPFVRPIDIITYPTLNLTSQGNTYNGVSFNG